MQFIRATPIIREVIQTRRFSSITSDFKHIGIVGLVITLISHYYMYSTQLL